MFATTYYASLDYSLNWNTVYAEQLYGEELVPDTDYIVTPDADGHGFSVDLTAAGRKKLDELDYKSTVTVWFDTTMNAKAEIGKANVNQPTLTWKNTNEAEQKVTGNLVKTYTYGLSLTKTGLTDPTKAGFETVWKNGRNAENGGGGLPVWRPVCF